MIDQNITRFLDSLNILSFYEQKIDWIMEMDKVLSKPIQIPRQTYYFVDTSCYKNFSFFTTLVITFTHMFASQTKPHTPY